MQHITIKRARTWHYRKMRPCIEQSNDLAPLSPFPSWLDCITNTSGYDFRKGQAEGAIPIGPFLDLARRQGRAPAADRRHPSHRTSSGKMTGAPRMERVQLNGADIEYDVRGSGAPVVFIHGAILSDGFVPVIEQTGIAENFQIVHYRRRGYAGSSRALPGMTMQGWAGDCIALLNHLGIASTH